MDCGLDGKTFTRPSLCKPQFAADCDLSTIVQRFLKTGQLPISGSRRPLEGDFTGVEDFQSIQDATARLTQDFEQLSEVERQKYNNDPAVWLDSLNENHEDKILYPGTVPTVPDDDLKEKEIEPSPSAEVVS